MISKGEGDALVDISGNQLGQMVDEHELTIHPSTYRLVDGEGH